MGCRSERAQEDVDRKDRCGRDAGLPDEAAGGQRADGGGAPERGGGVDPTDADPVGDDHAGAEEPDAADDVGGDLGWVGSGWSHVRDQHEHRGTGRDERVRAEPGAAGSPSALEADQCAAEDGGAKTKHELVPGQHVHKESLLLGL